MCRAYFHSSAQADGCRRVVDVARAGLRLNAVPSVEAETAKLA
jgi:hypothetical protein